MPFNPLDYQHLKLSDDGQQLTPTTVTEPNKTVAPEIEGANVSSSKSASETG